LLTKITRKLSALGTEEPQSQQVRVRNIAGYDVSCNDIRRVLFRFFLELLDGIEWKFGIVQWARHRSRITLGIKNQLRALAGSLIGVRNRSFGVLPLALAVISQ
jgi:hypothetical protein